MKEIEELQQLGEQYKADKRNAEMQQEQEMKQMKSELEEKLREEYEKREEKLLRDHEMKLMQIYREMDNKESVQIITQLRSRFLIAQWYFLVKLDIFRKRFEKMQDYKTLAEIERVF